MTIIARAAQRIALTLGLCLALIAGLALAPTAASAAPGQSRSEVLGLWMLSTMNAERVAHHLPKLVRNRDLMHSAHSHDLDMAHANQMSHQLHGESAFSTRITNAGYDWQSAGENIGWTSAPTWAALNALQHAMYNETAPANGHRLNILSPTFREVGIDTYLDPTTGKTWFTQDFGAK